MSPSRLRGLRAWGQVERGQGGEGGSLEDMDSGAESETLLDLSLVCLKVSGPILLFLKRCLKFHLSIRLILDSPPIINASTSVRAKMDEQGILIIEAVHLRIRI